MNCAIYIRKSRESTDKQGYRLAVQREQLPAFAKDQGWECEIYDDGHASAARGKAEHLPERSRLEENIRKGKINVILVIELSRLSRDDTMQDYVAWLTLCSDHGVKLATLTRNLDPSQNSDWMLLLMEGGFSSVEMKVIAGRMAEGRRQAFLSGKYLGGQCPKPYVYDKAERKPVVDDTLLKEMKTLWTKAETMSAKAIAEDMGLPEIAVRRAIADNRLLFYQSLRIDEETGEEIRCEWDPVMNADRAAKIKKSRRSRKTNSVRREAAGLLTALGIFRCGYCKKTVKSWNNSKTRLDGSRLDYYACVTKNKKNACPKSKMINHITVDEKVLTNLFSTLSKVELLKECWLDWEKEKASQGSAADHIALIKNEERKKDNLVNAIAEGLIDFVDAKTQLDQIKSTIAELQLELSAAAAQQSVEPDWSGLSITRQQFNRLPIKDQRTIISKAINKITLNNTYATIEYKFPRNANGDHTARLNLSRGGKKPRIKPNRTRA